MTERQPMLVTQVGCDTTKWEHKLTIVIDRQEVETKARVAPLECLPGVVRDVLSEWLSTAPETRDEALKPPPAGT